MFVSQPIGKKHQNLIDSHEKYELGILQNFAEVGPYIVLYIITYVSVVCYTDQRDN